MKIRSIKLTQFKRFADLTITDIPPTAKLVVLAGPNGCGKSSLFDALYSYSKAMSQVGVNWDVSYHQRAPDDRLGWSQCIAVTMDNMPPKDDLAARKRMLYFRSAYRNDPDFRLNTLTRIGSATEEPRFTRMIDTDVTVSVNYQRLTSQALQDVFALEDGGTTMAEFREKVLGEIRDCTRRLFPGLVLNSLGNPLEDGTFRFDKGETKHFSYKNLSGGEKAAFDLILDLVVKRRVYDDTVFCIDEPEAHMSTRTQGQLLEELVGLVPDPSQLWIATHSIGMMRKARDLSEASPGTVAFLDFGGHDFDKPVTLTPVRPTRVFWESVLSVALDDLALLVAPGTVVVCEGSPAGAVAGKNADHDATCYNTIFSQEMPDVRFMSGGNSQDVAKDRLSFTIVLPAIAKGIKVRRLIDRDDHAPNDITSFAGQGITVLSRRHLECYLFDDEVLTALCLSVSKPAEAPSVIADKQAAIAASVARGNAPDDVKSAAGTIYGDIKRRLGLVGVGNDTRAFQRETLAPLLRPGMVAYDELKRAIFG
ncbi:MAG: AAA family ATPase [Polyangiaceae bacterium]|nr:AAA family ATPase [Polyangiaceae bacterium]